jgi:hypothetical protein
MLKIGNKVLCRFYNTPDHKFYGDYFTGIILDIDKNEKLEKMYYVKKDKDEYYVGLHRKEIKKILK